MVFSFNVGIPAAFEQAYLALLRHWGVELTAMGIALPSPSLLGIHES